MMTSSGPVHPELTASQACSTILLTLLRQLSIHEGLIANPDDVNALHDYRISIRKTRILLDYMDGIISDPALSRFRQDFATLMKRTGPLRDLQICSTPESFVIPNFSYPDASEIGLLHRSIQQQLRSACRSLSRSFATVRHQRFKDDWQACLQQLSVAENMTTHAQINASVFARQAVSLALKKSVRQADKAERHVSVSSLHQLRKACKDLRYLLEMFAEVFAEAPRIEICKQLKQVQDRLGRMQDRQVLQHTLRETADRLEKRLGKHQHKVVKHLLKQIKTDKRRLMDESAIMASMYSRDSTQYIRLLLEQ